MCRIEQLQLCAFRFLLAVLLLVLSALCLLGAQEAPAWNSELKQLYANSVRLEQLNKQLEESLLSLRLNLQSGSAYSDSLAQKISSLEAQLLSLSEQLLSSAEKIKSLTTNSEADKIELSALRLAQQKAEDSLQKTLKLFADYKSAVNSKLAQMEGEKILVGVGCFVGGAAVGVVAALVIENWQGVQKWFQSPQQ